MMDHGLRVRECRDWPLLWSMGLLSVGLPIHPDLAERTSFKLELAWEETA